MRGRKRRDKKRPKKIRPLGDEITDLPNLITLARIATLPVVLVLIDNESRVLSFASAATFVLGSLSDIIDGYLARRRKQESVLGAFLDPLADKLFVLGTLVFLVARGRVPEWLVVVLMSRELAITVLRSLAVTYGLVIAAGKTGKAKTALQSVGIIFLLLHFQYLIAPVKLDINCHRVGTVLLYLSLVLSVWSAGEYMRFFVRAVEEKTRRIKAREAARAAEQAPQ